MVVRKSGSLPAAKIPKCHILLKLTLNLLHTGRTNAIAADRQRSRHAQDRAQAARACPSFAQRASKPNRTGPEHCELGRPKSPEQLSAKLAETGKS